jgi:hypothetical protein
MHHRDKGRPKAGRGLHTQAALRHWGGRRLGARWYSQEHVLERLEEYRRDLEQELADVSDLIRRLEKDAPPQGETATTTV